jgi:hypothetical protein
LEKLRPIALIETGKRIFSKILTRQIDQAVTRCGILQENNWAGTASESTDKPRLVLNNIIEDATENKKELWILLQDTKKAFDSVGSEALEAAMKRIDLPTTTRSLILEMRKNRRADIITEHGLTDIYEIKDGLDQGDPMSPLLWKILYDPLISKVNNSTLGYSMHCQ